MKNIFIILVNYNSSVDVNAAVQRLSGQNNGRISCQFIIVDNSGEMTKQYEPDAQVIVLRPGNNLGYCGGNNLAYSYIINNQMDGDVLICNPDTVFELSQLEYISNAVSEWGVYSLPGCSPDGEILYSKVALNGFRQLYDKKQREDVFVNTDFCPGSFLFLKRDAKNTLDKLFDERFFMYWEEVDLCLNIRNAGGKCCFINGAGKIIRTPNKSGWLINAVYYYLRNAFLIRKKHREKFSLVNLLAFIIQSVVVFTIKSASGRDYTLLKSMFRGIYDGSRGRFGRR